MRILLFLIVRIMAFTPTAHGQTAIARFPDGLYYYAGRGVQAAPVCYVSIRKGRAISEERWWESNRVMIGTYLADTMSGSTTDTVLTGRNLSLHTRGGRLVLVDNRAGTSKKNGTMLLIPAGASVIRRRNFLHNRVSHDNFRDRYLHTLRLSPENEKTIALSWAALSGNALNEMSPGQYKSALRKLRTALMEMTRWKCGNQ
jgi:hypothetical protein